MCRQQRESLNDEDEQGGVKGGVNVVTSKELAIAQPPKTEWETARAADKVCVGWWLQGDDLCMDAYA